MRLALAGFCAVVLMVGVLGWMVAARDATRPPESQCLPAPNSAPVVKDLPTTAPHTKRG